MYVLKDARGRESITLFLVVTGVAILFFKTALSGVDLGPLGKQQVVTMSEFGTAFALILAPWLGREWTEKKKVG